MYAIIDDLAACRQQIEGQDKIIAQLRAENAGLRTDLQTIRGVIVERVLPILERANCVKVAERIKAAVDPCPDTTGWHRAEAAGALHCMPCPDCTRKLDAGARIAELEKLVNSQAERIAAQSELLSRRACVQHDESTIGKITPQILNFDVNRKPTVEALPIDEAMSHGGVGIVIDEPDSPESTGDLPPAAPNLGGSNNQIGDVERQR